jgi:hypothetical protein
LHNPSNPTSKSIKANQVSKAYLYFCIFPPFRTLLPFTFSQISIHQFSMMASAAAAHHISSSGATQPAAANNHGWVDKDNQ